MVLYPYHPKAQLAVILVLKRLRRRSYGLKSHLTDLEKPGIEPATPGGLHDTEKSRLINSSIVALFCLFTE